MIEIIILSMVAGGFAGILSGMFGIGGGIVLVPFLVWLFNRHGIAFEQQMIMAVSTSLASIILTSCASAWAHHRWGSLRYKLLARFAPGLVIGTAIGSLIAEAMPAQLLKTLFAVFMFFSAAQMAFNLRPSAGKSHANNIILSGASIIIGALSSILGIGGGTLTVPFLLHYRYPLTESVATSSACAFPIAVAGSISYAVLGSRVESLPEYSFGYIYLPAFLAIICLSPLGAQLGAKLVHRLPTEKVKKAFALLLLLVGIQLLWK